MVFVKAINKSDKKLIFRNQVAWTSEALFDLFFYC